MISILKKELWSYFGSYTAWIIILIFSLISTLFLFVFENNFNIFNIGTASMQSFFVLCPWIFIFIIPAISMKSFAEEQQNGTLSWLFSQPIKTSHIVLGKFVSISFIGLCCLIPSLLYLYTIYILGVPKGNLDFGMTIGSYFGACILIFSFSALDILASTLSSNQISAYLIGVFCNFLIYFGIEQIGNYQLLGGIDYFIENLGFYAHYNRFSRGVIDIKDLCYFLMIITLSVYCSIFIINKKK